MEISIGFADIHDPMYSFHARPGMLGYSQCSFFARDTSPTGVSHLGEWDGYAIAGQTIGNNIILTVDVANAQHVRVDLSPTRVPMRGPGSMPHANVSADCSSCSVLGQRAQRLRRCSCDLGWWIPIAPFSVVSAGKYEGTTTATIMCHN